MKIDVLHNGKAFRAGYTDKRGYFQKAKQIKFTSLTEQRPYQMCGIGGKIVYAHRLVAEAYLGKTSGMHVDHIDGDRKNNRVENLRIVTAKENCQSFNRQSAGTSKYRGVHKRSRKGGRRWVSSIRCDGVKHYIGCFYSELEAAVAYNDRATELGFNKEALNQI